MLETLRKELSERKTGEVLKWATQNKDKTQLFQSSKFILSIHEVNFRQLLNKAVDIHFNHNYRVTQQETIDKEEHPDKDMAEDLNKMEDKEMKEEGEVIAHSVSKVISAEEREA